MNPPEIDKSEILAALRAAIEIEIAQVAESQRATQEGATHEEARPEHSKDTRATESAYLARGLAGRTEELREAAAVLAALTPRAFGPDDEIAVGALVGLRAESEDSLVLYFLTPVAGGRRLSVRGASVSTLTPGSPLGSAVIGRLAGDEVESRSPKGVKRATLSFVR